MLAALQLEGGSAAARHPAPDNCPVPGTCPAPEQSVVAPTTVPDLRQEAMTRQL